MGWTFELSFGRWFFWSVLHLVTSAQPAQVSRVRSLSRSWLIWEGLFWDKLCPLFMVSQLSVGMAGACSRNSSASFQENNGVLKASWNLDRELHHITSDEFLSVKQVTRWIQRQGVGNRLHLLVEELQSHVATGLGNKEEGNSGHVS